MGASNADEREFWNSEPGRKWVRHQADLDAILQGASDLLLAAGAPQPGETVLDVGCGTGASSFAFAAATAPTGHVDGVDISALLIERALEHQSRLGLQNVTFTLADAQDQAFAPGRYDLVVSRFGLMFFSDPVAAFRNIAVGLRSGGRIVFAAWDAPDRNPWFSWPHRSAVNRLGATPPPPPDAPGAMAFRDIGRVVDILQAAGYDAATGSSVDVELHHPGGLDAVLHLVSHLGPVARMMREKNADADDLAAILQDVAAQFRQFESADGIRIPAKVNLFAAKKR